MLRTTQPLELNAGPDPAIVLAASFGSASNVKPTVLIVEDDNYVSAAMWALLTNSNFDVAVTANGAEGLKLAQALSPDIIVLDVNLPGMNGLEICRHLKADLNTSDVPVVFLSGQSQL